MSVKNKMNKIRLIHKHLLKNNYLKLVGFFNFNFEPCRL